MIRRKIKRKPNKPVVDATPTAENETTSKFTGITDPEVLQVQKAKRQRLDSSSSSKGVYKVLSSRSRKNSENASEHQNSKSTSQNLSIPAVIAASPLPPVEEILQNPETATSPTKPLTINSPFRVPESPTLNSQPAKFNLPQQQTSYSSSCLESLSPTRIPTENEDVEDTQSIASSQASTASTTYRRIRAQEVKSKLKSMEKDKDGKVIIDKDQFPLADLIYVSRYVGAKKTGLQIKREEFEAKKRAQIEQQQKDGVKVEASEEAETAEKKDDNEATETEPKQEVVELTEIEQSRKTREEFDSVIGMTKVNDKGELIIDNSQLNEQHPDKKKIDQLERVCYDEVDAMNNYKRCYQKRCTGKARRWREKENLLFWEALAIVGQDFQLMECYFKQKQVRRNKSELKSKFSREDRAQPKLVTEYLKKAGSRPLEMTDFITEIVGNDSNNNIELKWIKKTYTKYTTTPNIIELIRVRVTNIQGRDFPKNKSHVSIVTRFVNKNT